MKKITKTILAIFILIITFIIAHPEWVVYEAEIRGKILDKNGNPIENAEVSRIEEKHRKNEKFGYKESIKYKSQTVKTDADGKFKLEEKAGLRWKIFFGLPFVYCYADFEVYKEGYQIYKTEFGDFEKYNKNHNGCKGIKFEPIIELEKN